MRPNGTPRDADAQAKAANDASTRALEQSYQRSIDRRYKMAKSPLILLMSALLVSACSERQIALPLDSQHLKPAAIPALPPQARQPPVPSWFAHVFKRAEKRAGDLAGHADQSHAPGETCEKAYGGLSN